MKKLIKYLKIASCCFALTGIVFGSIYSVKNNKDFSRVIADTTYSQVQRPVNDTYYQSVSEITGYTDNNYFILHHDFYLNSFAYANPNIEDVRKVLYGVTYPNFEQQLKIYDPVDDQLFWVGDYLYDYFYLRASDIQHIQIGVAVALYGDDYQYIDLISYDGTQSMYGTLMAPVYYQTLFSSNFRVQCDTDNSRITDLFLWFYSSYSPNYFTLQTDLTMYLAGTTLYGVGTKPYLYDNKLFYSPYLENEYGYFYGTRNIEISQGGIFYGTNYYNSINVKIASVYYPNTYPTRNYYEFRTYMDNPAQSLFSSYNASYQGYYYVYSIELINKSYDTSSTPIEVVYDYTEIYSVGHRYFDNQTESIAFEYQYYNGYAGNLKILYSSCLPDFTNTTTIMTNTSTWGLFGQIIAYAPVIDSPQITSTPFVFSQVFDWINIAFIGLMPFLSFQVFSGITLGAIISVPLVVTLILFIVRLFKR